MPLFVREFECPSCGASVEKKHPSSKSVSCPYCGQTSHIQTENLEKVGEQHLLIDYGSVFSLGMSANVLNQDFTVLGRLRLSYEDGFWDEWFIHFTKEDKEAWIQEDDGSFVLFKKTGSISMNYESVNVGKHTKINNEHVFITSKARAKVEGGEGELPFKIVPGETADFVEGIVKGEVVSVEFVADENIVYKGVPFQIEELIY